VIVALLVLAIVASRRRERRLAALSAAVPSEAVEVADVAGDDGVAH